jgi:hypothetical protein
MSDLLRSVADGTALVPDIAQRFHVLLDRQDDAKARKRLLRSLVADPDSSEEVRNRIDLLRLHAAVIQADGPAADDALRRLLSTSSGGLDARALLTGLAEAVSLSPESCIALAQLIRDCGAPAQALALIEQVPTAPRKTTRPAPRAALPSCARRAGRSRSPGRSRVRVLEAGIWKGGAVRCGRRASVRRSHTRPATRRSSGPSRTTSVSKPEQAASDLAMPRRRPTFGRPPSAGGGIEFQRGFCAFAPTSPTTSTTTTQRIPVTDGRGPVRFRGLCRDHGVSEDGYDWRTSIGHSPIQRLLRDRCFH